MRRIFASLFLALFLLIIPSQQYTICNGNGEGCLLMRNVLRDPLRLSNWKTSSMNRAINQLQAYQQLFEEDKRSSFESLTTKKFADNL